MYMIVQDNKQTNIILNQKKKTIPPKESMESFQYDYPIILLFFQLLHTVFYQCKRLPHDIALH